MTKYCVLLLGICLSIGACCEVVEDRLVPSGKTVMVPQAKQFCQDHPGDSACSQ